MGFLAGQAASSPPTVGCGVNQAASTVAPADSSSKCGQYAIRALDAQADLADPGVPFMVHRGPELCQPSCVCHGLKPPFAHPSAMLSSGVRVRAPRGAGSCSLVAETTCAHGPAAACPDEA